MRKKDMITFSCTIGYVMFILTGLRVYSIHEYRVAEKPTNTFFKTTMFIKDRDGKALMPIYLIAEDKKTRQCMDDVRNSNKE